MEEGSSRNRIDQEVLLIGKVGGFFFSSVLIGFTEKRTQRNGGLHFFWYAGVE